MLKQFLVVHQMNEQSTAGLTTCWQHSQVVFTTWAQRNMFEGSSGQWQHRPVEPLCSAAGPVCTCHRSSLCRGCWDPKALH